MNPAVNNLINSQRKPVVSRAGKQVIATTAKKAPFPEHDDEEMAEMLRSPMLGVMIQPERRPNFEGERTAQS